MNSTKKIVITALFTAFIALLTMFPHIRLSAGIGYIHLGDALIIAAVFYIGKYSIAAAAIGSAIADTILGFFLPYAPITFVIKGLMALSAYLVMGKSDTLPRIIIAAIICEIIMFAGYFLFDTVLFGFAGAVGTLVFSLVQAASGIVIGTIICYIIRETRLKEKYNING